MLVGCRNEYPNPEILRGANCFDKVSVTEHENCRSAICTPGKAHQVQRQQGIHSLLSHLPRNIGYINQVAQPDLYAASFPQGIEKLPLGRISLMCGCMYRVVPINAQRPFTREVGV